MKGSSSGTERWWKCTWIAINNCWSHLMCPSCQFLLWNVPTVNIWVWAVCPPAHVFCSAVPRLVNLLSLSLSRHTNVSHVNTAPLTSLHTRAGNKPSRRFKFYFFCVVLHWINRFYEWLVGSIMILYVFIYNARLNWIIQLIWLMKFRIRHMLVLDVGSEVW